MTASLTTSEGHVTVEVVVAEVDEVVEVKENNDAEDAEEIIPATEVNGVEQTTGISNHSVASSQGRFEDPSVKFSPT